MEEGIGGGGAKQPQSVLHQSHGKICRYFAQTGKCFYGDQCNFLHVKPNELPSNLSVSAPPTPATGSKGNKSQTPCRNVIRGGVCSLEGKGCEYNHDLAKKIFESRQNADAKKEMNSQNQLVTPQSQPTIISQSQLATPSQSQPTIISQSQLAINSQNQTLPTPQTTNPNLPPTTRLKPNLSGAPPSTSFKFPKSPQPNKPSHYGTAYYNYDYPEANSVEQPYLMYHQSSTGYRELKSFFMSETLRQELQKRTQLIYAQSEDEDIPPSVSHYHTLYPLDHNTTKPSSSVFGFSTSVYKAISSLNGRAYCLRKVEGFRLSNENALKKGELWRQIRHPNVVPLVEMFVSKDFGDVNSLFFSYNYYPGSITLEERYFKPTIENEGLIPENILWSYACQLISALKTIHSAGLAVRTLVPSKILLTGRNRIRINCCGMKDVINLEAGTSYLLFQLEDLVYLGQILLNLACKSPSAINSLQQSIEFIQITYSPDFTKLVLHLLSLKTNVPTLNIIDSICQMIAPRLLTEMEQLHLYSDNLESDLSKEMENGRLFRILVKLGFINERPEFEMDQSWSETGDRYLLKLFRDYVFHQVYEDGIPVIDFGHVVDCLNKLDAGVDEKVVLMSRDEQSLLVVSYKDLRRCVEESFHQLRKKRSPG